MTQVLSAETVTCASNGQTIPAVEDGLKTFNSKISCDVMEPELIAGAARLAVADAAPVTNGDTVLGDTVQALPPPPANLAGSSQAAGKNYSVTVSNKAGYLCHVHVVAEWPVPPEVPFQIFTHPDNSALFRDVKRVGARKVVKTEPGYKEVQVEQLGEVQVLWIHRAYSTWLHVVEDARDPECLRIKFDLLRSDVLGRFGGNWELRPVRDPSTGAVVGCRGELQQDVLPKGMPSFMARLPILGGTLRGISVRTVTRVLDDFNVALDKVLAGHAAGRTTEAVLRELCGAVSEAAHANGAVTSFAFDPADGEEDEEDEETAAQGRDEGQSPRADGKGAAVEPKQTAPGIAQGTAGPGVHPPDIAEDGAAQDKSEPAPATPDTVLATAGGGAGNS